MYADIIIIDFEDSFTYNISNILFQNSFQSQVIHYKKFFKNDVINSIIDSKSKKVIILGPGPGHPDEYKEILDDLCRLSRCDHIFIMGICLGHQLLALRDGLTIKVASIQYHGQSVEIKYLDKIFRVMKYNSLAVFENNIEVEIRKSSHYISYQFHPESVGTSQSIIFFYPCFEFLNSK